MEKSTQFMMMVQTALLTRYASDPTGGSTPICRSMWAIEHMEEAFRFATCIPGDVTAREAAEAFIRWVFREPLEDDDKAILKILLHE